MKVLSLSLSLLLHPPPRGGGGGMGKGKSTVEFALELLGSNCERSGGGGGKRRSLLLLAQSNLYKCVDRLEKDSTTVP